MLASSNELESQTVQVGVAAYTNGWASGPAIVLYLAALKLILHLMVAGKYGYMQDELYYMACSDHLDWGYVDHPPLIAWITKIVRALIGDSLLSLRFLPAIAGAALVWLTGGIARILGGGRFAQGLAALGVIVVPIYLTFHYILSMNAFEPLFWIGLSYVVLLAVTKEDPRLLVWAGVIIGFGLLNKYSMAIFGAALCLGILLTPHRKLLASKWLWIGGGICLLIVAPHLHWLVAHHFPFLQWQRNIHHGLPSPNLPFLDWRINVPAPSQLIQSSTGEFILQQLLLTGTSSLIWLAGLVFFFGMSEGKPYRFLGWTFVITMALLLAMHAKNYYPAPVYAIAIAGGAVALERMTANEGWARLRTPFVGVIVAVTIALAPMFLPLLPIDFLEYYQTAIGMHPPQQEKAMMSSSLSVFLAGQFGWEALTSKVAKVYDGLPSDDRRRAAIYARTYAPAAAIDFFGTRYGLPKAISGHLGYFLWGPGHNQSDVIIFVGYNVKDVAPFCKQLEVREHIYDPYNYPNEMNKPVMVCRGLAVDLQTEWSKFKLWY